jgi:hypothetical protein
MENEMMEAISTIAACGFKERTMNTKFVEIYSGEKSEGFWSAIIWIKNEDCRELAYSLGCALQNHEADLLSKINTLIEADRILNPKTKNKKGKE